MTERKLILEDGQEYTGYGFGAMTDRVCELVFNTSMAGYQEILSDPSYTDQAVVMTYPLIGNYGMAPDDYETARPTAGALVVREYNDRPSSFRSEETLGAVMERFGIPGIREVDTRMLTRSIRDLGSRKALITDASVTREEGLRILRETELSHDAVSRVSCGGTTVCMPDGRSVRIGGNSEEPPAEGVTDRNGLSVTGRVVAAIDCGMKENIIRSFNRRGVTVIRVPWDTDAADIRALDPDGIFISNGPGDPEDVPETVRTVRELIGYRPVFGICLGHQIIALAYGARTYKLKFGHRGGNHPVRDLETGKIEITSQNHSYAVDRGSLDECGLTVTHVNLLDQTVEGLKCVNDGVFSVQYHPESAPGPRDSGHLFDRFMSMI